jgi:Zn-dependent protease with chaperone function
MRSARSLYRLYASLAFAASAALAVTVWAVARVTSFQPEPVTVLLEACRRSLLPHLGFEHVLILISGGVGMAVVLRGTRSAIRHCLAARRTVARVAVVSTMDAATAVRLVADPSPQAFCAGLLRPRVYISTGAVALLSADELAAVVEHESHHAARRDPLRLLTAQVVGDAFFFLPALRHLRTRYAALAELAADEAAIRRLGGPQPLASAMLAFGEQSSGAVVGFSAERVDHLLGVGPRWKLSLAMLLWMFVAVAGLVGAALLLIRTTEAAEVHGRALLVQSILLVSLATGILSGARRLRSVHGERRSDSWQGRGGGAPRERDGDKDGEGGNEAASGQRRYGNPLLNLPQDPGIAEPYGLCRVARARIRS